MNDPDNRRIISVGVVDMGQSDAVLGEDAMLKPGMCQCLTGGQSKRWVDLQQRAQEVQELHVFCVDSLFQWGQVQTRSQNAVPQVIDCEQSRVDQLVLQVLTVGKK